MYVYVFDLAKQFRFNSLANIITDFQRLYIIIVLVTD